MAQLSKQNLTTKINDLFGDNLTGAISAADLREVITDVVDSYFDNSNTNFTHNSLKDFGAIGDGVNYDDSAITAALNSGFAVIDGQNLSYKISGEIELPSNTKFINAKIIIDSSTYTDQNVFKAVGTVDSSVVPTADIDEGSSVISVPNGSIFSKGDYVFLKSDAIWSIEESAKQGEILRIKSITGNDLTLETKTLLSYKATDSFSVRKINMITNLKMENVQCVGNLDDTSTFARFEYCKNIKVSGNETYEFDYAHYNFVSSIDFLVDDCTIDGTGTIDGLNYGIAISFGCVNGRVQNSRGYRCRHFVTIGGSNGISRHISANYNYMADMYSSGLDSHAAVYEHTFIGNTIYSDLLGINIRGAKPEVKNNTIIGVEGNGIAYRHLVNALVTDLKVTGTIKNNDVFYDKPYTSGDAYGVYVYTQVSSSGNPRLPIEGLSMSGNMIHSNGKAKGGIYVLSIGSAIKDVQLSSNQVLGGTAERGIYFQTSGSGTISDITLSDNRASGGIYEAAYLRGHSASSISDILVIGNKFKGGTIGFRLNYVDDVKMQGNKYGGHSSVDYLFQNHTNVSNLDAPVRAIDLDFSDGKISALNIDFSVVPTSSAGLDPGDIWNDAGTLKIV